MIVRAWREYTDDIRAGAAKWDQRWEQGKHERPELGTLFRCGGCGWAATDRAAVWRHKQQCTTSPAPSRQRDGGGPKLIHMTLAKRLVFGPTHYMTDMGWQIRMLLTWQRLVRAGKVCQQRKHAPMWKEAERGRRHRLTEQQEAAVRRGEEEWMVETGQVRGVRYDWKQQDDTMRDRGVTSGAAAVLSRRRHSDSGSTHDGQSPPKQPRRANDSLDEPHTATASRREPPTVSRGNKRQRDGGDDDSEELERRRHRDAFGDG